MAALGIRRVYEWHMRPSDLALISSLAQVSRHACLRRLAHRRGNRYIIWVLGYEAKRAA